MQEFALRLKQEGRRIGLVPTMGALHEGHLTLMRAAKEATDFVIASVFVNPTQFGPNEDFDAYPRRFEEDCRKLESVDGDITHKLCGAQRPIHFRGVATVVTKLFNITQADEAFFGQKDAQQVVVVCRFVQDLNLPVHINMVPIVREESGLARSSRNVYLSPEEKTAALVLSRSLRLAKDAYEKGERNAAVLKALVTKEIAGEPLAAIDYVDLFSFPALEAIETVDEKSLLALAVRIGKTRLIDNIILG